MESLAMNLSEYTFYGNSLVVAIVVTFVSVAHNALAGFALLFGAAEAGHNFYIDGPVGKTIAKAVIVLLGQ